VHSWQLKTNTLNNKKILIIIPCFNEEQNIVELLADLADTKIDSIDLVALPINDGSKDGTLDKIKSQPTRFINLPNNLGIGGAVQTGIKYAFNNGFDYAIQMDGDGQHPPSELIKIINEALTTKCDICIGSRYINAQGFQSTFVRRFGINFLNNIIYLCTRQKVYDCTSGYRLYNKNAILLFSNYYPDKYPEPEAIVYALLHKLRVKEVPVLMKERKNGVSSISGFSTIYYMVKVSLAIVFLKISFMLQKKY
jgi:glycosyltransferase involved in cell wall biosynthesis